MLECCLEKFSGQGCSRDAARPLPFAGCYSSLAWHLKTTGETGLERVNVFRPGFMWKQTCQVLSLGPVGAASGCCRSQKEMECVLQRCPNPSPRAPLKQGQSLQTKRRNKRRGERGGGAVSDVAFCGALTQWKRRAAGLWLRYSFNQRLCCSSICHLWLLRVLLSSSVPAANAVTVTGAASQLKSKILAWEVTDSIHPLFLGACLCFKRDEKMMNPEISGWLVDL